MSHQYPINVPSMSYQCPINVPSIVPSTIPFTQKKIPQEREKENEYFHPRLSSNSTLEVQGMGTRAPTLPRPSRIFQKLTKTSEGYHSTLHTLELRNLLKFSVLHNLTLRTLQLGSRNIVITIVSRVGLSSNLIGQERC